MDGRSRPTRRTTCQVSVRQKRSQSAVRMRLALTGPRTPSGCANTLIRSSSSIHATSRRSSGDTFAPRRHLGVARARSAGPRPSAAGRGRRHRRGGRGGTRSRGRSDGRRGAGRRPRAGRTRATRAGRGERSASATVGARARRRSAPSVRPRPAPRRRGRRPHRRAHRRRVAAHRHGPPVSIAREAAVVPRQLVARTSRRRRRRRCTRPRDRRAGSSRSRMASLADWSSECVRPWRRSVPRPSASSRRTPPRIARCWSGSLSTTRRATLSPRSSRVGKARTTLPLGAAVARSTRSSVPMSSHARCRAARRSVRRSASAERAVPAWRARIASTSSPASTT